MKMLKKFSITFLVLVTLMGCDFKDSLNTKSEKKLLQDIPNDVDLEEFVKSSMFRIKDKHPSLYFDLVNTLYENEHYAESAFVFYIGNYSYKLYNHANPNFKKADKRQFDVVSFKYGFENYDYLQSDHKNYSEIMFQCLSWYKKHPPKYFDNQKEKDYYADQLKELEALAIQLRDDPEGFEKGLEEEKQQFELSLN